MAWIVAHAELVSASANFGILLIWAVYAHLFYRQHRRQDRPRIIIDQMLGRGQKSLCVVANMSAR